MYEGREGETLDSPPGYQGREDAVDDVIRLLSDSNSGNLEEETHNYIPRYRQHATSLSQADYVTPQSLLLLHVPAHRNVLLNPVKLGGICLACRPLSSLSSK